MKYKYAVLSYGDVDFKDAHDIESSHLPEFADWVAEDCAEDFHSNHDGWESKWPLDFKVWYDFGEVLGVFQIEREYEPLFSASAK